MGWWLGFLFSQEDTWIFMWAWAACNTWYKDHFLLWNLKSFRTLQMYQKIKRKCKRCWREGVKRIERADWTPSSPGSIRWRWNLKESFQTSLVRWHRKRRWASISIIPQTEQQFSIWVEYLIALSAESMALLMSLQAKFLRKRGTSFAFQTCCRIVLAWEKGSYYSLCFRI
jgi:hypothetical protein